MDKQAIQMVAGLGLAFLLSGCAAYMNQPLQSSPARLGEETTLTSQLRQLPPPKEKVVAAVYKFRDQTGQYKPAEVGANWSTAVTQGATSILIKAMDDSGWFVPIERENVGNLLNERKIIRSSRQQYEQGREGPVIPPLLFAGIILEGGIISYDANIVTGGAGLRYFGAGASGQYRQDRVTVYLRAISTSNGKVLKTVYTSKTILSQAVDAGLFRFVKFQRLLEVETGFTYNEPSEMAVTEAIEKAVQTLVLEGIIGGLWQPDPEKQSLTQAAINAYKLEKTEMAQTSLLNRRYQDYKHISSFQFSVASLLYDGDYPQGELRPGADLGIGLFLSPRHQLLLNFGASQLAAERFYREDVLYADLNLSFRFLPHDRMTPYLFGGGGVLIGRGNAAAGGNAARHFFKINGGIGFEYHLNNWLGIDLGFDHNFIFSDELDERVHGKYNDYFWRTRLGVKLFLN